MMLTRCSGCTTTFRVTPEQLKVRQGRVRCGQCQKVFNAIEHLVDVRADAPAAQAETTPTDDDTIVIELSPTVEPETSVAEETPSAAPETSAAAETAASDAGHTDSYEKDTYEEEADGEDTPVLQPSPLSDDYESSARTASDSPRWPWLIAALLALIVLLVQALTAFRVELAAKHPAMKPLLTTLCQAADCTVGLPSDPDLVSIEASDLHPGRKGGLELTATLRNRAPYAQAWPDLELTLTDPADKPIVRKVLTPAQYLPASQPAGQSVEKGFAASSDIALQLALDPGTLPADGYRLYLFYP